MSKSLWECVREAGEERERKRQGLREREGQRERERKTAFCFTSPCTLVRVGDTEWSVIRRYHSRVHISLASI